MDTDKKQKIKKLICTFALIIACVCTLIIIAELTLEPISSSPEYCNVCHEMTPAYKNWKHSPHGNNKIGYAVSCQKCHLPSKEKHFFHYYISKICNSTKDTYKHFVEQKYDAKQASINAMLNIPNSRCLSCHNNLLQSPGILSFPHIRKIHKKAIENPQYPENRCIRCHSSVGHKK